jgi:hypothetical protein
VKIWMAVWTIGVALMGPASASAQDSQSVLTVRVRVDDNADVSRTDLADAQVQATAAYRTAGLAVLWSAGSSPDPGWESTAFPSVEVRVVIVPRDMAEKKCREEGLGVDVMGVAISAVAEARGRIAYVFYDRVARAAIAHRIPVARGLGHVMAHEIGHLLIGVNGHSEHGLMSQEWNPREQQLQTFTSSQVQIIRNRFMNTGRASD